MDTKTAEHDKYVETWDDPWYSLNSPAQRSTADILAWLEKNAARHVLDFGCGVGRMDLQLARHGYEVRMLDIAENCLDPDVKRAVKDNEWDAIDGALTFENVCLWDDEVGLMRADAVICIDVLEHLPPEHVATVCQHLRAVAPHGFVNAALFPHSRNGHNLHLTLQEPHWWFQHFSSDDLPDVQHKVTGGRHAWMIW